MTSIDKNDNDNNNNNKSNRSQRQALLEESMGGLAAGIIGTIIGFPLDLIKTRMQTASKSSSGGGIMSTGVAIVRREGVPALYKGVVPPLLSLSILNTLNFTAYSYFQSKLGAHLRNAWDVRNAAAGAACGLLASPVSTVENLVKTQMQLDNVKKEDRRRYKSTLDCVQQIMSRNRHIVGSSSNSSSSVLLLYKGHAVNTVREMAFLSTYFYLYEGFRHVLVEHYNNKGEEHDRAWAVPFAGGLAGASAWAVSFPLDCVRAGVQGQDLWSTSRNQQHLTAVQVFGHLLETKGIRGLYAGVTPSLARAFLVSASRFSAYEGALWLLRGGR